MHMRWFADWMESTHGISYVDELRVVHLRGWITHLQKRPSQHGGGTLSDASIQSYGRSLLAFCHWLEREEVLEKPITTRIFGCPAGRRSPFLPSPLKRLKNYWRHVRQEETQATDTGKR